MSFDKHTKTRPNGPFAFIQWKGTDVCLDVHCECGAHGHIDGDFVYTVRCKECGRVYDVGGYVPLLPAEPDDDISNAVDFDDGGANLSNHMRRGCDCPIAHRNGCQMGPTASAQRGMIK